PPRGPPSFPTRRSSDLVAAEVGQARPDTAGLQLHTQSDVPVGLKGQHLGFSPTIGSAGAGWFDKPLFLEERDEARDRGASHACQDRKSTRLNSSRVKIS